MKTVTVSADALRQLLQALDLHGPAHYLRELQVTRNIDESNPIEVLISEYYAAFDGHNEENDGGNER